MKGKLIGLLLLTTFLSPLWAARVLNGEADYWQCSAEDATMKQWTVKNSYKRIAMNKAYDACKKQSHYPGSCKIGNGFCDPFILGKSTSPMWQCTALDHMANTWVSDIYKNRDQAALSAKADCKKGSGMPDTCYINLITCVNLNGNQ